MLSVDILIVGLDCEGWLGCSKCMWVGGVGTFWNESRQGIVAQQERELEARRETTLVFFPYQSSHCKKKNIWSHSSGSEDSSAKLRSCLLQRVRLKDEILILAPLFQQLCHVQHHSEQNERCHQLLQLQLSLYLKEGTHKTGKWKSHWDVVVNHCWLLFQRFVWQSTRVEYLENNWLP